VTSRDDVSSVVQYLSFSHGQCGYYKPLSQQPSSAASLATAAAAVSLAVGE